MEAITRVLERMQQIEQRFQVQPSVQTNSFPKILAEVEQANPIKESAKSLMIAGDIPKMIQFAAKRYGVDERLALAIAKAESNFSPEVVSDAGAVGVMQLMPETAQSLGVKNIRDPRENVDGGVRYLKQLLDSFQGDVTKAVAAYNAGPAAVQRYGGVPPYGETKAYVAKVLADYRAG